MAIELAPEERKAIVEQHIKNTAYAEYNVDLNILEANAPVDKETSTIEDLTKQKERLAAQKSVLIAELNLIEAEIAKLLPEN